MRIQRSDKTGNVLISLSTNESIFMMSALESHMKMRGAQLADSTSINDMDAIAAEISTSMKMVTRLLEVTDDK